MDWWRNFLGRKDRLPPDLLFKLRSARLRRMHRNYKKFLDLVRDAVEKQGGEFVIDRRYLSTLVENACAIANELVYDANVMAVKGASRSDEKAQRARSQRYFQFDRTRANFEWILAWQPDLESPAFAIPSAEVDELEHYHQVGGIFTRMAKIRELLGISVPEGFVIPFAAFHFLLEYNGLIPLLELASSESAIYLKQFQERLREVFVPYEIASEIQGAVSLMAEKYGNSLQLIMSPVLFGEECHSSYRENCRNTSRVVTAQDVVAGYKEVLAELYGDAAIRMRLSHGLGVRCDVAVAVSRMIVPRIKGKIYTSDPEFPQKGPIRIEAFTRDARTVYEASRSFPYDIIAPKGQNTVAGLSREEVQSLCARALSIERYFKSPQEIAFLWEKEPYVTHIRPLHLKEDVGTEAIASAIARYEILYRDQGKVASPGIGSGKVHLVEGQKDLLDFPDHGILVSTHLDAGDRWVAVLPKVAGILADEGKPTGIAASLAREFHIPAIVGLTDVTRRLLSGDMVTIDAGENTVYRGIVEELLDYQVRERFNPEDEMEYYLLRFVLHRLSSGSLEWRKKVRGKESLDDVARRSLHEAVCNLAEIVIPSWFMPCPCLKNDFGYRLYLKDIGRGMTSGGKMVDIDSITSRPFKALWSGISGAPLHSPKFSAMALVAKQYCHLARKGARYIVDAYQCEETDSNYVYAYFKDSRNSQDLLDIENTLGRYGKTFRTAGGFAVYRYALSCPEADELLAMIGRALANQ